MKSLLIATVLLIATAAQAAPVPVRTASPDEAAERRAFLMLVERIKFLEALFGLGNVPESCRLDLIDPAQPYSRTNLFIKCPKRLTLEDR